MPWHFNPSTGIYSKYADTPEQARAEIARINSSIKAGQSIGGASPEYGQTLATLLLLPIGAHAATLGIMGATAARTTAAVATGAGAGITATGAGIGAAGAITGASLLGLATTGAKIGFDIYLLEWLQKNWWIPALLIGGYLAVMVV